MEPVKFENGVMQEVAKLEALRDDLDWDTFEKRRDTTATIAQCAPVTGVGVEALDPIACSWPTLQVRTGAASFARAASAWISSEAPVSSSCGAIRTCLGRLWSEEHAAKGRPSADPEPLAAGRYPRQLGVCLGEDQCLCDAAGRDFRQARNNIYAVMKQVFKKDSEQRRLLEDGSVVLAMRRRAEVDPEAGLAGSPEADAASWSYWHVSVMYFSPYRATLHMCEWVFARGGGVIELRAVGPRAGPVAALRRIGLGPSICEIKFWKLFDSDRLLPVFDPSILNVVELAGPVGGCAAAIWPPARRAAAPGKRKRKPMGKPAAKKKRADPPPLGDGLEEGHSTPIARAASDSEPMDSASAEESEDSIADVVVDSSGSEPSSCEGGDRGSETGVGPDVADDDEDPAPPADGALDEGLVCGDDVTDAGGWRE